MCFFTDFFSRTQMNHIYSPWTKKNAQGNNHTITRTHSQELEEKKTHEKLDETRVFVVVACIEQRRDMWCMHSVRSTEYVLDDM